MKNYLKRTTTFILALLMLLSVPLQAFADGNYKYNYDNLAKDKAKILEGNENLPVKPAKTDNATDLIKNPDQPAIYTLRTDYKVQRGEKYEVNYQPYIASVGAAASDEEKAKVKKTIDLPAIAGYDEPQDNFTIDYNTVKNAADGKGKTGDDKNGIKYQANEDFRYKAQSNQITIKHVFQDLEDFTKYTNPDGSVGEKGQLITTQQGNTGSTMEVSPLDKNDPRVKGFVPEADSITMQVPENATNFILEYRYNRAHYDVNFDTKGGTPVPNRTLYYEQIIPTIDETSIPKKTGCDFLGWMPSITLEATGGKSYPENEIIKDSEGNAIIDLHNTIYEKDANGNFVRDSEGKLKAKKSTETIDLKMPASKITFTAVWEDKPKADYAIQFWVEKSDHADNASLMDKYDYMGTRVYKDAKTGSTPNLDAEPVKGLKFPDLNDTRLQKIWNGARFNRGRNLFLNKFYVYNQDLTHDQNKDPENVNLVKSVDSTGKTVYNIYYDRQVYDLYFTKSNAQPDKNTFYPEIYGRDQKKNELVKLGGPGNLYHYKARFNELMYGWPNDAMQTKGFTEGYQSFGWGPNYATANWPVHLDTPPYRLNADEFLDMAKYDSWGGYVDKIDDGAGGTIKAKDFTTLSFGIKQDTPSIPHHMDFWMDGFKDGETIIRYDLVRTKADTADPQYTHRYPKVTGFTAYDSFIVEENQEDGRVKEDRIDELNDEREDITPYPGNGEAYYNIFGFNSHVGELKFIPAFFSNADEFGDPLGGEKSGFKENGYLRFKYKRNKYPLRFNYDPSIIRDDSYFNSKNQLDTFYEFPLKALSPDVDSNDEYKKVDTKEGPKNLLDNPENLQKLGLKDLVFTDPQDNKLKVKRPDNLSDQMVFKGWALDPAGTKLIWENPGEKMPFHPLNLYAKWGEPDYKWKVTFDPNGGSLRNIKEENLTTSRKKIQEGDIGQEEVNTYAKKEANEGDKQVFTVIQRQKLVEPKYKPTRKGYDFMGWEVIRYKKDANTGDYTNEQDTSYRETYKVPELYSFGNDVVAPVYLKAIWVPNARVDVKVEHYMLDKDYKLVKKLEDTLEAKRANYLVATTGDKQDDEYILAPHEELEKKLTGDLKTTYEEYNKRVGLNNSFFQTFRVEPEKILNTETNKLEDNPKVTDNVFKFFYRPFRQREYKVNYIDERFRGKETEEGAAIIEQELVTNGNRHYDARNYRRIPGWVLAEGEKPQQQLFFDVNEDTNEFLGINGTKSDEITFYYKDVRVIEVPNKDDPVPDGYVRVTFKAEKGGSFGKDAEGKDITELNYDVIKGLKSQLLPVPKELAEGETADKDKHYITPETGKKFLKWDKSPLLNDNTIINEAHTFTAYFEWSGLSASGLVRTEAFKDPNNTWTNDFAPKIEDLKKQLVWMEKGKVAKLPAGAVIKLYDETGKELTSDDQVYDLVNEKKAADKDELVRTVNVKAKVKFKDGKDPQELVIPITVYKNVYEALTGTDKPKFLSDAEKGELKDITGNYVKVTVNPTGKPGEKDSKIYYVNPKAWVEIPEIKLKDEEKKELGFTNWTADKEAQNENGEANGVYDFNKRHKFTEDTVISPGFSEDVVPQEDQDKPKVPDTFVKVIVKTTDKATTELIQTFWVNPTKEVTIPVTEPTGKTDQEIDIPNLGKKKVNYVFNEWQKVKTGEADDNLQEVKPAEKIELSSHKYTDKVTVIEAAYFERFAATPIVKPIKTDELHTPEGKEITDKDLIDKITPPENKEIESITVVERPNPSNPGKQEAKVTIKYKDGSTQGTNDNPVIIPVEVHKNIIPEVIPGQKPKDALDNYVKVIFKAGTGGTVSGDLVYYVSPEVEVDMTESAGKVTKTPDVGYISGDWDTSETKTLKATFTAKETEFTFNFTKTDDIVEKTPKVTEAPKGYVTVKFITDGNGHFDADATEKVYYVNPTAGITLKVLGKNETATDKQLAVPTPKANDKFTFKEWQENIDEKTPITSERTHVAIFESGKVTLTYEKGGADVTGDVPATVTVNVGTTVRLAGKGTLDKPNSTFAGWKLDGDETIYQPGDQVILDKARTATAQWTAAKHTVTFDTVGGTHIDSQQVKHEELITSVGNPEKYGYFFVGWKIKGTDKVFDPTKDKVTEDITLVAQYSKDIIPEKDDGSKPEGVPDSFVLVEFKKGSNGTLTGTTKYWVNPTAGKKLSDIAYPSVTANDGWKHTGWDKTEDTKINTALEVTAKYLMKVLTEQPTENAEKYVKVEFKPGDHGTIDANTTSTYWVLKDEAVTLTPPAVNPNTGYAQKTGDGAWSPKVETSYRRDTEHVAQYDYNGDDVISQPGPDRPDNVPENFVLVEFKPGDHGTIAGTTKYWVNPTKLVTLTPPTVTPNTGYEQEKGFGAWDKYLKDMFTEYTVITAQYRKLEEPCPVPTPDPDKPNPDNPNPWDPNPWNPDYPNPDNPYYPERPYFPMYPEVRYETVIQEKVVEVPVPEKPYMKEVRYMQGFKGEFRPKDGLTRAEAAQILANALVEDGYKYNPNFKLSYKDIGEAWYTRAVKIVTEAKVFAGYDDGNFKPQDKITRNEWIATLKRFQELGDVSGNHMKLKDGHWALGEIEAAYEEGWLKIYTDGLAIYEGDKFIPREEVAAVSNKAFKRILDKTYIRNNEKNLISYKDVKKDMWSYEDILCASNTFLYKKDLYRAHWIKEDNNQFNINTDGFEIVKAKFQRNPR